MDGATFNPKLLADIPTGVPGYENLIAGMRQDRRREQEIGLQREANDRQLRVTQSTEGVNTLLESLSRITNRKEYEAFYGSLVADPQIRSMFESSRYHFDSFRKAYDPTVKFGNEEAREQDRLEKETRDLRLKTELYNSPEMQKFVESKARLDHIVDTAGKDAQPMYVIDNSTQIARRVPKVEVDKLMASPDAGKFSVMQSKDFEQPVYILNPITGEYEDRPVYRGQLPEFKKKYPEGVEFSALTRAEYEKHKDRSNRLAQSSMATIVGAQELSKFVQELAGRISEERAEDEESRADILRRLMSGREGNTTGFGRTGKYSLTGYKAQVLKDYIDVPEGATFWDKESKRFVDATKYRERYITMYNEAMRLMRSNKKEDQATYQGIKEGLMSDRSLKGAPAPMLLLLELEELLKNGPASYKPEKKRGWDEKIFGVDIIK